MFCFCDLKKLETWKVNQYFIISEGLNWFLNASIINYWVLDYVTLPFWLISVNWEKAIGTCKTQHTHSSSEVLNNFCSSYGNLRPANGSNHWDYWFLKFQETRVKKLNTWHEHWSITAAKENWTNESVYNGNYGVMVLVVVLVLAVMLTNREERTFRDIQSKTKQRTNEDGNLKIRRLCMECFSNIIIWLNECFLVCILSSSIYIYRIYDHSFIQNENTKNNERWLFTNTNDHIKSINIRLRIMG